MSDGAFSLFRWLEPVIALCQGRSIPLFFFSLIPKLVTPGTPDLVT